MLISVFIFWLLLLAVVCVVFSCKFVGWCTAGTVVTSGSSGRSGRSRSSSNNNNINYNRGNKNCRYDCYYYYS